MRSYPVFAIFFLLLAGWMGGGAQGSTAPSTTTAGVQSTPPIDSKSTPAPQRRPDVAQEEPDPFRDDLEKHRQKELKKARFTALKRDADKLLELATELKTHVDKADENMLSLDVIKKTDQIEKLAKSVRDKMKGY